MRFINENAGAAVIVERMYLGSVRLEKKEEETCLLSCLCTGTLFVSRLGKSSSQGGGIDRIVVS